MITLLATTNGSAWLLLVCIAVLLGTHLTTARLSRSSYVPLIARLLLFPTVFFVSGSAAFGIDWIFQAQTIYTLGQIAAIEACLQHWKHTPSEASGRFSLPVLLLWCLVYLCGANTNSYRGEYIVVITPLFMLLLGWTLLDWKPTRTGPRSGLVVAACWGLAIGGGFGLHKTAMIFKNELMGLGSQFMRDKTAGMEAGGSNRPHMGSSFGLPEAPRRVLRIEGALNDSHLRSASFDRYQDGYWNPPLNQRGIAIENSIAEAKLQSKPGAARTLKTRITRLIDLDNDPVFAPLNMVSVRALSSTDVDGPTYDYERSTGLLRCVEPNPFTYEITESAQSMLGEPTFQGALCEPHGQLTGEERSKYLQIPDGFDPRVKQIADEATQDDDTPNARALSIARYLMSTHHYSPTVKIEDGSDPVVQFIVQKKDAHCEFFAASMVLLCRSVGVPARYVIGYLAHEPALGEANVLNVRQRDSHAWAEVWIDGVGWLTADATPADGRPQARAEANSEVSPTQKWSEWASDLMTRIRNRAASIPRSTWGWIIGVPLALWLIIRGRPQAARRRARHRSYAAIEGNEAQRLESLARDFEKWMAAQKLAPLPSRSWQWFLQREQRESAARWAKRYEAARFGHATPDELARLEAELQELRAAK